MSLFDFIGSAAGGTVLGSALNQIGRLIEPWNKKREAQVEIMLLEARTTSAERIEGWNAFAASQAVDSCIDIGGLKLETLNPVVRNCVAVVSAGVGAFRTFTRPGLTWSLLLFLIFVWTNAAADVQADLTKEITFGAFTALFWWFGARPTRTK